jgi:serine protease inhibitor
VHALFAAALVCSAASGVQPVAVSTADLVRADNNFGFKLFRNIAASEPQQNVFLSPLSIAIALQMTAQGSAGATWNAMAGAMGLSGLSQPEVAAGNQRLREALLNADKNVRLDIANSLWLRSGIKVQGQFEGDCDKYYAAPVTTLDFSRPGAATTINDWVSKNTGGRIKRIATRLDPAEFLILANAFYLKGSWTKAFNPKHTASRQFHTRLWGWQRPMMSRKGTFRYREDDAMQAVVLSYGEGRLSMYVFLPRESHEDLLKEELDGLIAATKPEDFAGFFVGFEERRGTVVLPRFKIEFEQDLNEALIRLGMGQAFKPGADFSGIVSPPDTAFVSRALHKACIEVNEEGTEAAAAAAVIKDGGVLAPEEEFSFVCDHPFLCAIRDDVTGSVLFIGAVYDPKQ